MVFDGEDHGYGTNCANLSYRALTTAFRLAVEKNAMERLKNRFSSSGTVPWAVK
jgi:hypothetical protein